MKGLTPICNYCGNFSKLTSGAEIYPHRKDLKNLRFYSCSGCDAYVGTHKGTVKPLGRLANKELRKAKSAAHRAFDPLWKLKNMTRKEAYSWLAKELGIKKEDCHIGMFDVDTCKHVESKSLGKQSELCGF